MRLPFDGNFEQTQNWNDSRYRSSYTRFGLLGHNGEDYGLPAWTPVLAPHAGVIKEATFDTDYGNYVKVESSDETSILAHLSKISVNLGDTASEGQLIGYSGNTGNSTGAHLHWGYFRTRTRNRDNGFVGYIDQTDWLNFSAPTPEPINDKTKYDFGGEIGTQEMGAVRSMLNDLKRDLTSTKGELAFAQTELSNARKANEQQAILLTDLRTQLDEAKKKNSGVITYTYNGSVDVPTAPKAANNLISQQLIRLADWFNRLYDSREKTS